jgi:7-carboxy-7-deazaguanine synthase
MSYAVKETLKTLQGKAAQMGGPPVYCRFVNYNHWPCHAFDHATSVCIFCDIDILGMDGTRGRCFADANALADVISAESKVYPTALDLNCASSKAYADLMPRSWHELNHVYPQASSLPDRIEHRAFNPVFFQPIDSSTAAPNLEAAITYCTDRPCWHPTR